MPPRLLLFTKPAIPGRVKTRLAATIGATRAAELHRAFVGDVAERLRAAEGASDGFELELLWALEAGESPPDWPETRDLPWRRQQGEDLGSRLFLALAEAAKPDRLVAAVGSDHPELHEDLIHDAFARLRSGSEIVLGPAYDGGYYLIALRPKALKRRLFEHITWSTDAVLEETLERAAELGLLVSQLPSGHDIDHEDDLRQLAKRLEGGEAPCPRTRKCLGAWGFMEADTEASQPAPAGSPCVS